MHKHHAPAVLHSRCVLDWILFLLMLGHNIRYVILHSFGSMLSYSHSTGASKA